MIFAKIGLKLIFDLESACVRIWSVSLLRRRILSKRLPMISRNEILYIAYNIVENSPEGIVPEKFSSSKLATMIFLSQLKRMEIPAYLSRVGELIDHLDKESCDRLRVSTVNGLHGPLDYDYVVTLTSLMIECWNKVYTED